MKRYYFALILLFNVHLLKTSNIDDKNNIFKYGPVELIKDITEKLCHQIKLNDIAKILEKSTIDKQFNKNITSTLWYITLYKNRIIQDIRYECFDETRVVNPAIYQEIYGNHLSTWFPDVGHLSSINAKNVEYYVEELNTSDFFKTFIIKKHRDDFSNQDKTLGVRVIIKTDMIASENYTHFDDLPIEYPIMLELPHGSTVVKFASDMCNYFREKNIKIDTIKFPRASFYIHNQSSGNFSDMLNNLIKDNYASVFLFNQCYFSALTDHIDNLRIGFYGSFDFPIPYFHNVDAQKQLSVEQEKIITYFIDNGLLPTAIEVIAENRSLELLWWLKKYGANFNQVSSKYKPLLCYAFCNLDVLRELIKLGADCNAKNFQGDIALSEAIKKWITEQESPDKLNTKYWYEVIKILFENGAQAISCPSLKQKVLDKFKQNPSAELFDAVKSDNYDKVVLMLAIGTKVNSKNEYDRSLLCYVTSKKALKILIKNGLKIDESEITIAIDYLSKAADIENLDKRIKLLKKYFNKMNKK